MCSIEWWHCRWPWVPPNHPKPPHFLHFASPFIRNDFNFGAWTYNSTSHPADEKSSLKGAWSRSREQFLRCGLRKFRHSKSSVHRWYTQLDRRRYVYDTYKTMKATHVRHGWVHMFTTHWPTLTLQLHNFDLFRTCCTALLRGNWQDFNWHYASHGPSAIAELLVLFCGVFLQKKPFCWWPLSKNLVQWHY